MTIATPVISAPSAALSVEALSHRYPASRPKRSRHVPASPTPAQAARSLALDDVSLSINAGEIFAILGPNGGGKTTLFRILTNLLRPTAGRVSVLGLDVATDAARVRQSLGVVFQMPSLDAALTARENLTHQGHLYGLDGAHLRQRIDELLTYFGMADQADAFVAGFSGGMRRRVELAKALLHQPRVLLLDEPSTGLDPGGRADLWQYLTRLRKQHGMTIVLTTHLMDEADRCDRLAVLNRGKLIALDTPEALKSRIGGDVISVEPVTAEAAESLCAKIRDTFAPWPVGGEPRVVGGRIVLQRVNGPAFVGQLSQALGDQIRGISVGRPTLEDVFLHLTGHRLWDEQEIA